MGWGWDDFVDAVEDVGDAVVDAADATVDAIGSAASEVGDVVEAVGDAVDTATGGAAGWLMNATDDYVFDTVDFVTGGVVDVDFDDGTFSASVGIDGVASTGIAIGTDGISADGTLPGASYDIDIGDGGLAVDVEAGINWGPLPYVNGHVEVSPEGHIVANGEIQGTIPTPVGLVSGEAKAGFADTEEGWGAYVDADGTLLTPEGTVIKGSVDASHVENASGSHTSVAVGGSVKTQGGFQAGGAVAYDRQEQDGDVVESFHAEGQASGYGVKVGGEVDYDRVEKDGVEVESFHAEGQASGYGVQAGASTDYKSLEADGVKVSSWDTKAAVDGPGDLDATHTSQSVEVTMPSAADFDPLGVEAPSTPPVAAAPPADDPLGVGDGPSPAATAAPAEPVGGTEPTTPSYAAAEPAEPAGPDLAPAATQPGDTLVEDPAPPVEAEAAPVDEFDATIEAADQVDASTQTMFEDL